MRSSLMMVAVAGSGLAAAGCATAAQGERTCAPILSWASPAWECTSVAPAAEPEPAPEPAPVADAPPPEPPPERVVVKEEKIEINEKVQFETNSAVLKKESESLLDDVAKALKDHPEIKKVRIEGHTDSRASDKYNKRLSKKRADAVRAYLVGKGVSTRLSAVGYGEEKPIADNKSEDGRYQNRRVEFTILKREGGAAKPEK